jgi:hypothetical protein
MVSVTLKISNDFKALIDKLQWVNWSEIAREEIQQKLEEEKALAKVKKLVLKSNFTEKDAEELSEKVKKSMHNKLKRDGLV